MLKLEKTSDRSGLTIRLREKERFFEPRLVKALIVALLLHCSALLFFHITPFTLFSTFTFPALQVQSTSSSESLSTLVLTSFEEEDFIPPPLNMIPVLDWISPFSDSTLLSSLPLDRHAFQALEEQVWPKWQEPLPLALEEPSIQLVIGGELADYPLRVTDPLLSQLQPFSPFSIPIYITYNVQVDEKTGEIFWYECTQASGIDRCDHLTKKILLNLRFAVPDSLEFIKGSLNFLILVPP